MAELCGQKSDNADCERDLGELAKSASPDSMARLSTCVADANTCAAATGCLVGAGMSTLGDAFQQFMKGFSNTVGK
jgi:hypothetical protein